MDTKFSILIGVIASPVALILVPISFGIQNPESNWQGIIADYFMYIYPIAIGGVIFVGLPAYFILRHFGYANYITLATAGLLGGAAFGSLAMPLFPSMLLYAGCGLVVASCFWLLVVRLPNPDNK